MRVPQVDVCSVKPFGDSGPLVGVDLENRMYPPPHA